MFKIVDFPHQEQFIQQAARLLMEAFREIAPDAWPDLDAAADEMRAALQEGRICRAAMDESGRVLGWIGAIREYDGNAWELHPLVVDPELHGRGIGSALVADLEAQVRARGGVTVYLGTDDETNRTTLSNTDLYPDVSGHIQHVRNLRRHPYEFYQKQGYVIVGVIPDANGFGKPDILMAKRVGGELK